MYSSQECSLKPPKTKIMKKLMFAACCIIGFLNASAQELSTNVLFSETFSGNSVSSAKWNIPYWISPTDGTYVGRTQFRCSQNSPLPLVRSGYARIELSTYNPTGFSLYGTDLISKRSFKPTSKGILVTYVARMQNPFPKGMVAGLFLYSLKEGSNTLHDEIDFELLGNSPFQVHTNIYANEPLGYGNPTSHKFTSSATSLRTYQILWKKDSVSWYVNGKMIRTVSSAQTPIPTGPMRIHVNVWAPGSEWLRAYNPGLAPTYSPSLNKNYYLLTDSITVEEVK